MMNNHVRELLDAEPEACLPCNLSDDLLELLSGSAENMLEEEPDETKDSGSAIVTIILRLLFAKKEGQSGKFEVSFEELQSYVILYRAELALEEIHRKTHITYNPATLETILTEREIVTRERT